MTARDEADVVIIGGGFFGCCLALFLRSVFDRVIVIEAAPELLTRASRVNQARVHSGYHYPRSFVTALRSRELSARFVRHFGDAVVDDFRMLYAIARRRSKVSTARFVRMFRDMGAPIAPATPSDAALFDAGLIEGVFDCPEFAFDWTVLRDHLARRLDRHGVELRRGVSALRVVPHHGRAAVELDSGGSIAADYVFNVTYAGLNRVAVASGYAPLPLKYELAEVALVEPPAELAGKAVTVMDGPFFSLMPYPAAGLYSLTHVRYTPHMSWIDRPGGPDADAPDADQVAAALPRASRALHMIRDTQRYLPCAAGLVQRDALFEVKTILTSNERDDGRPILLHRHAAQPWFASIMGGKIDNIYDLFDALGELEPVFAKCSDRLLVGAV